MLFSGTEYHRFTVRTLHKYVLNAVKTGKKGEIIVSPKAANFRRRSVSFDQSVLARANTNDSTKAKNGGNDDDAQKHDANSTDIGLGSINEIEQLNVRLNTEIEQLNALLNTDTKREKPQNQGAVTYRERLGGFLHPRDMRKLVTPFSASNEPEVIVRRHAILLNFDPLRAIILRDRLLVLVPDGADSILVQLEKRVRGSAEINNMTRVESKDDLSTPSSYSSTLKSFIQNQTKDNTIAESTDDASYQEDSSEAEADQAFINAFVDDEWEELEAKDWIDLPFELQSVDAVLHCVCTILGDDVIDLQWEANNMIQDLLKSRADVGDHTLEVLRTMKNSVKEMTSRVNGFRRALDVVLEDYEDMALMNLSRLLTHPERFVQPVPQSVLDEESDEPELILEAHLQRGHTLTNALSLVQGQINTTEDFAVRKSDTVRNRLLYINLMISILSLAVTLASVVGSMFGMNVINHFEDIPSAFRNIILSTIGGVIFFIGFIIFCIKRMGALPHLI